MRDPSIVAAVGRLHHVPGEACTPSTAQTAGMSRLAALSGDTVGSRSIWMGETHVAPGVSSGPHHHGDSETGIYVVSGNPEFIYSEDGREVRLLTKPGDYIYVPPFVHHIESNANSHEEAVVVIARTTQEAIVENLEEL
ncbi:MAG TPA: cupin domain-containing protein [Candidatus Dormibacteraeota bacterium]|nr:cupin domain-containing protein [Candidatus Dormibacteraeota bacterium]